MNEKIDAVIHKLDALMNGAQPGDTEPPPFVPPVLDTMRAVVRELTIDCRTCEHFYRKHHLVCGSCVEGDRHNHVMFVQRWKTKP